MFGTWGHVMRHVRHKVHVLLHLTLLYTLAALSMGGKMCQKRVPVTSPSKKVHVLKRVPATCSQWEKAWTWITSKDCGTKYRLDLVDLPSRETVTYRMEAACCEGDPSCEDANGLQASSGLDVSDEKFLAIVLGSTAAAVFVIILIVSISLCRKKKQCSLLCEERRHIYANTEEADEISELQGQKECHLSDEETENKLCESVYAEIDDSGLPRYTDIFKEPGSEEDPFTRATAPPLYDTRLEETPACEAGDTNVKEVLQGTADILERESRQGLVAVAAEEEGVDAVRADKEYYNVASKSSEPSLREEAMLNLTKDDPAVVSAGCSTSPKDAPPPPQQQQADCPGCDDGGHQPGHPPQDCKDSLDKRSSVYEKLAHSGDKDAHEYQKLTTKNCAKTEDDDLERSVDQDMRAALPEPSPGVQVTAEGHVEPVAEC